MFVCRCSARYKQAKEDQEEKKRGQKTGREAEQGDTLMYWLTIFRKVDTTDKLELPKRRV